MIIHFRIFAVAVIGWSLIEFGLPPQARSADAASTAPLETRKTVAAGFGFQNAESSTITVKTYDAESGEILSNESYELDIKEDGSAASPQPRERIFAGGVGLGNDGLSEFTLRVYDAATGRFLWEGRLNLGVSSTDAGTVPAVACVQPGATVSRTSRRSRIHGHPYFLLRAVDPETGQLVWADQFSTGASSFRAERIGRSVVGATPLVPRNFDFRIRMFDESGQQLVWEDNVTPAVEGSNEASGSREEDVETIPLWRSGPSDPSIREKI